MNCNPGTGRGREGQTLLVHVYSKAPGAPRAQRPRARRGRRSIPRKASTASFNVPYQPGVLRRQRARRRTVVATCLLRTSGPAVALAVLPELPGPAAERSQLIYVPVEIRDASGALVPGRQPGART